MCRSHPAGWEIPLRLRIRFEKTGKIRFIGHRDVARVTERAVRKVGLPVAYSEGFSPRMRLSFGLALPTGYESDSEYLDLPLMPDAVSGAATDGPEIACAHMLAVPCAVETTAGAASYCSVAEALSDALPCGMCVSAVLLQERVGPSLQSAVRTCGWRFDIQHMSAADAADAAKQMLEADHVVTTRVHKGRTLTDDVRGSIFALSVVDESCRGAVLAAELSATPRVVRPSELVPALAAGHEMGIARRTHQWTCTAGVRAEPATPAQCCLNRREELVSE